MCKIVIIAVVAPDLLVAPTKITLEREKGTTQFVTEFRELLEAG